MQLAIKADFDKFHTKLRATKDLVDTALEKAVSATARDLVEFNKLLLKQSFDRPTPFTLNGFYWAGPKWTGQMKGGIYGREFAAKGTPAFKYLMPNIKGGPRHYKRHEKLLKAQGHLQQGMMTAPGKQAQLDQYGNIPGSTYTRLLAEVGALVHTEAYTRKITGKSKPRTKKNSARHFVMYKGGRPIGVYERVPGAELRTILNFITPVNYRPRYPFYEGMTHYVQTQFPIKFGRILKSELDKYI